MAKKDANIKPGKLEKTLSKFNLTPEEASAILVNLKSQKAREYASFSHNFSGKHTKIGVVGDTHFGNKWTDKPFLRDVMKYFKNQGVDAVYHPGDITDGPWQRHKNVLEQYAHGFDAQVQDVVNDFPDIGKPTYLITGNHDCLSSDTEALTKEGWKKFYEINKDDKILSYENGQCFWDKINKIILKQNSDDLINIENKQVSLLITKNHRVLNWKRVSDCLTKLKYTRAEDLIGEIYIPTSASLITNGLNWSNEKIALMAWILTDGSCKNKRCVIWQSKPIEKIEKILKTLNIDYKINIRNRKIKSIMGKLLKKDPLPQKTISFSYALPDKYPFPLELFDMNDEQFEVFLNSIIDGDGSRYKSGCLVLYGKKEFLDKIQALCHMHNYRSTLTFDNRGNPRLNICKRQRAIFITSNNLKKQYNSDIIWCLSVPKTNFMIRRNGKVCFTGNSWYLKQDGGDVGKSISMMRPDIHYLGPDEAIIKIGKLEIMLSHPDDGNAYAYSYKGQKFIESIVKMGENLPDIILQGHYHKIFHMNTSGTHYLCTGTTERQTPFLRGKKIAADMGAWELDIYRDTKGNLTKLVTTLLTHTGEKHKKAIK